MAASPKALQDGPQCVQNERTAAASFEASRVGMIPPRVLTNGFFSSRLRSDRCFQAW
jgi:hypothetical protein